MVPLCFNYRTSLHLVLRTFRDIIASHARFSSGFRFAFLDRLGPFQLIPLIKNLSILQLTPCPLATTVRFFIVRRVTTVIIIADRRSLPKKAEHGAPITSNNKYDLLFGVTTSEALWKFAERDVLQGFEGERRDRIIRTYVRNAYVYHLTEIFYTVGHSVLVLCFNYSDFTDLAIITTFCVPIDLEARVCESNLVIVRVFSSQNSRRATKLDPRSDSSIERRLSGSPLRGFDFHTNDSNNFSNGDYIRQR